MRNLDFAGRYGHSLSAGDAVSAEVRNGESDFCIRDGSTGVRTCIFCFSRKKGRKGNRSFVWSPAGIDSDMETGSFTDILLYIVFDSIQDWFTSQTFDRDFWLFFYRMSGVGDDTGNYSGMCHDFLYCDL